MKEPHSFFEFSQKEIITISTPNRIIIATQINSKFDNGNCGRWRRKGGGIGENLLEVEFKTNWGKGASWTVKAWSVDATVYDEEKVS
jgi:Transcription activator MBF2